MTVTQDGALTWTIGGVTYEVKARRIGFDPDQPRDRKGRWIETGASVSIWGGSKGTVARNLGGGFLEVDTADKRKLRVHRNFLTVIARPDGSKPSGDPGSKKPAPQKVEKPSAEVEDFTPDADERIAVTDLQPGQAVLVYGNDKFGSSTSAVGWVQSVEPEDDGGHTVTLNVGGGNVRQVETDPDAVARPIPEEPLARLVQAERDKDPNAGAIALEVFGAIRDADDEAASRPAAPASGGRGDTKPEVTPDRKPEAPAPNPDAAPDSPIDRMSSKPLAENVWGAFATSDDQVNFHDDGVIGTAIKNMGQDVHLDVDGEPLANVLGHLATDAVVGRRTSQEVLDQIKKVRDRLPEGSAARREVDSAVAELDAPNTPAPEVPDAVPEPLRQLVADLHAVPLVRRDPDKEMTPLLALVDDVAQGRLAGRRLVAGVSKLLNRRHESFEGKMEIDRAVNRAVQALEALRGGNRRPVDPPVDKPAARAVPEPAATAPEVRPQATEVEQPRQPDVDVPEEAPPPPAPEAAEERLPQSGQWITTPAFNDPVRIESVQDTLTGSEVNVRTVRGDERTFPLAELGDWQPTDDPGNTIGDRGDSVPAIRGQQGGLFADMGTDRDGNTDLFAALEEDTPPSPTPKSEPEPEAVTPEVVEARIRDAYAALAKKPGDWVNIRVLRDRLGADLSREQVDEVLTRMIRLPDVNLVGDANQKVLTLADRAAAVRIGEQDKHLISIIPEPEAAAKVDLPDAPTATTQQLDDAFQALGMPRTAAAVTRARTFLDGERRSWTPEERAEAVGAMRELHAAKFAEDRQLTRDRTQARWARDVEAQFSERAASVGLGRLDKSMIEAIDFYQGLSDEDLLEEISYARPESDTHVYFLDELGRRGFDAQGQPLAQGSARDEASPAPDGAEPERPDTAQSPRAPEGLSDAELDEQVEQGQRRVDAARAAGTRNRDDGDSALAEALNAPLVAEQEARRTSPAPEPEAPRPAAPAGRAYADEIQVGDTLAEAALKTPTAGPGRLRQGSSVYANPGGPARPGEPDPVSRTVTALVPYGDDGVRVVFDDGTTIIRNGDDLVTRGVPAEVVEDGRRVGEWVPAAVPGAGDRIRFEMGAPTLPTRLMSEIPGLGRGEKLTVEGRIVRSQPGMSSAVMADAHLVRADGTRVPVDQELLFRLPGRVVRLDDSEPAEAPREVLPGGLHDGDRISTPGGDVQVESVESLPGAGVAAVRVRDGEDRRSLRALDEGQPVRLATDAPAPPAAEEEPVAVELAEPVPLREGTRAGRVRLRTDQRKRLLALNLDDTNGSATEGVRRAAARLRARQDLSSEQMRVLSNHLRALSEDETQPGASRRGWARAASWIDAAEARLEGFPPPPHNPNRDAPEKAHARNLTMGDVIAVPDGDGNVSYGTVTVVRPIKGYGLVAVHLRRDDGSVDQRVLPDGVDLWVMPDLPEDRPAPPRPDVREHIRVGSLNAGDDIVIGSRRFGTPITGTVVSVERTNQELSAIEWYDVTVRAEDGSETTIPVGERGWASVVRTKRGPSSQSQSYATPMPDETPEPVGRDDIQVGDRALIEGETGVVTGMATRPGGATFTLLGDDGQQHTIPVFDDDAEPPAIVRLIAADDNAGARIIQQMRYREQVTRERELTEFLAGVETRSSRTAAAGLMGRMRALPADASEDDALGAAEDFLDEVEGGDDGGAAAALARRLGARDEAQQAELAQLTRTITDGVSERATGRIRSALRRVDRLPGESWTDAVTRLASAYRDHPPAERLALAGRSLEELRTRLRDADTRVEQPPALPDGADLPARLASYRAALPEDLANLGRQPVTRAVFDPTTLGELEGARVPTVRTVSLWAEDVADDDGPGEQAMAHLATLRAAGRDVDVRFQHHLGGREEALNAELEGVTRQRGRAHAELDKIDRDVVRQRRTGRDEAARAAGYDDFDAYQAAAPEDAAAAAARVEQAIPGELIQRREAAGARWQQHTIREAELRGMVATARRDALIATLGEIRPTGGDGITYTDRSGKPMTGRAGSNAAALKYVEQALPADWLAAARALGPVEVVTGPGQHRHDPDTGRFRIGLPTDNNSAVALRDGAPVRVAVPSPQPGAVPKAAVAAHELGHHMEASIPGLVEAQRLLHFDRTSFGPPGDRSRSERVTGTDRGSEFDAYPGDFPNPYTGRVYRDGEAYEVFTSAFESLAGGRDSADDDLRHWGLGVLALLGTDAGGPSGGTPAKAKPRDPLEGIDIEALSDSRLKQLLASISDPDARARLRAELDDRNKPPVKEDLSDLGEAELLDRLEKGWARYGEDLAVTDAQDRVIAELEGRQRSEQRGIDDLTASDLATMDTDDLAGILTGNWHRYDNEAGVAAMLDQIMAELDGRDRARNADQGDPYAGIDLKAKGNDELEELRAQHEATYDSDPNSARLTKRIFAEMDDRDVAAASREDGRSDTDRRIDDLISQGWTPRDAYAEVHGLNPDDIEREERLALVDAQRAPGERREDTLRRMHRQWVHEQWLEAEGATRGYLLNRAGVAAGIDPESLWGGNSSRAAKYASEELKRWWAEQSNGGRMTYTEWRAQWVGDQADRREARDRRQGSTGRRDFGL
uniref:hypothetical protein n=1 Tax=Streptosporangium sp. CA-235898 TaxID=3240073 RepID=UPI003F490728